MFPQQMFHSLKIQLPPSMYSWMSTNKYNAQCDHISNDDLIQTVDMLFENMDGFISSRDSLGGEVSHILVKQI